MNCDIRELTGSDYCYHYRELPYVANEEQVRDYCRAVKDKFRPLAKALDERSNALWLLRCESARGPEPIGTPSY